MNPSYFSVRLPLSSATERLRRWLGVDETSDYIETDPGSALDLAVTADGQWRGKVLFFYERAGWSVFEDLSGGFGSLPASSWLAFAETDDFVFAGYNDAIPYGELVVIERGAVVRQFMDCPQEPAAAIDVGRLDFETDMVIASWKDMAAFVDDDELAFSARGWLWIVERERRPR